MKAAIASPLPPPLVWAFNGAFASSLADLEDTLRRALVQVGEIRQIAVAVELSLPALQSRVSAGEQVQPAWGEFLQRAASRYGLPRPPQVRHRKDAAPLLTLIVAYRS